MSSARARARRPGEEALTHLHQMTESLKLMVRAARIGSPEEESNSSDHAIELHACTIAHAADALLALIHELRANAARNDLAAIDGEIGESVAAEAAARRARAAGATAARDVPDGDLPYVPRVDLTGATPAPTEAAAAPEPRGRR